MTKIDEFVDYAIRKHMNQRRDNGIFYITHPIATAMILIRHGYGDDVILGAIGHDLLEDTDASYDEILNLTNKRVANAILLLTKIRASDAEEYYFKISKDDIARPVKVADRMHNLKTMSKAKWSKRKMRRYYDASLRFVLPLAIDTRLENEFSRLLKIVVPRHT